MYFITDIDECLDNNGECSLYCINTVGSYYCKCPTGYILQSNQHDCEGRPQLWVQCQCYCVHRSKVEPRTNVHTNNITHVVMYVSYNWHVSCLFVYFDKATTFKRMSLGCCYFFTTNTF